MNGTLIVSSNNSSISPTQAMLNKLNLWRGLEERSLTTIYSLSIWSSLFCLHAEAYVVIATKLLQTIEFHVVFFSALSLPRCTYFTVLYFISFYIELYVSHHVNFPFANKRGKARCQFEKEFQLISRFAHSPPTPSIHKRVQRATGEHIKNRCKRF